MELEAARRCRSEAEIVVDRGDDQSSMTGMLQNQLCDELLTTRIEVRGWFIEQPERRVE